MQTPIEFYAVYQVPMPTNGESLEEMFNNDLHNVMETERECGHVGRNGNKCTGKKWERSRQEMTEAPNSIVLSLNRGYYELDENNEPKRIIKKNRDGTTSYSYVERIDRTKIKIDKTLELRAPPRAVMLFEGSSNEGNTIRYQLAAATQHFGKQI